MEGTEPIKDKGRAMVFFGLSALGVSLFNLIRSGINFWGTAEPASGMPGASATQNAAQPILERFAHYSQASAGFKATAESATASESFLYGVGSRISSAAGTVFGFAKGLSWTTMGVAGLVGALGTLYLVQRYWKGYGGINNTNNNHVNINIHFTGINPTSPPIIEQKVDKNGTNLFVKMPQDSKFRKTVEQVLKQNRNAATAA